MKHDLCAELGEDARFLEALADKLDAWAKQSVAGGWSTHQVDANRKEADQCRLRAGRIRRIIAEAIT